MGISSESDEQSLNHATASISSVAYASTRDRGSIKVFSEGIVAGRKGKVESKEIVSHVRP